MKSLADVLGVPDLKTPDVQPDPVDDPTNITEFCQAVLNSRQYRESLMRRIMFDELPQAIELWMCNTAYGKPVDRVEVTSTSYNVDVASTDELEQRVLSLLDARRRAKVGKDSAVSTDSVH